jgi:steroid delta-isomerase-like uncharacterized protein
LPNVNENEQIIRSLEELANRRDGAAIHAFLSETMRAVDSARGDSAANRMHAAQSLLLAAFPDLHYQVLRTTSSGNVIVAECVLSGTHTGQFAGLEPTNKSIEIPAAFCIEIDAGKLTECRSYFDTFSLMQQIGGIPLPATPDVTTVAP